MINHSKFCALIGYMFLSACLSSCLSPVAQNEIVNEEDSESRITNLSVSTSVSSPWSLTRASEESVPLPIRYYLFDSKGTCLDLKTAAQNDASVVFQVEREEYTIYALCGEMTDAPTVETAKQSEFLNFIPNADVCLGSSTVSVSDYGMTNNVQIKVNHIFSLVSLSITGVPESVIGISATFNDLYEAISLDGVYDGTENAMKPLEMSSEDPSLWILSDTYLYPSSTPQMPVTLKISSEDGSTQVIQTSTEYILKSGVKNNLCAQFQALSNVSAGVIVENSWQTITENIDFWGDDNNETGANQEADSEINIEDNSNVDSGQNSDPTQQEPDTTPENNDQTILTYRVGEQFGNTKTFVLAETEVDGKNALLLCGLVIKSLTSESMVRSRLSNYNETVNTDGSLPTDLSWRAPSVNELNSIADLTTTKINSLMNTLSGGLETSDITDYSNVCFEISNSIKTCKLNNIKANATFLTCSCFPVATYVIEE